MRSKFFLQIKNLPLLAFIAFLTIAGNSIAQEEQGETVVSPDVTPQPHPKEVGYIRLLLNDPQREQIAVTVQSTGMRQPETLFEGPGMMFVGSYFEIPAGRCRVSVKKSDREISSSEVAIRDKEFFTINLLLPLRGNTLPIERDGPPDPDAVVQRFRIYNFSGSEFQTSLKFGDQAPRELPENQPLILNVPEGTHPIEIAVLKPSTEEFGKIVSEGQFNKGSSLTMVLYRDYRGKVGSRMFYDGVLD